MELRQRHERILNDLVSLRRLVKEKDNESALELLAQTKKELDETKSNAPVHIYLLSAYGCAYRCVHGQDAFKDLERNLGHCCRSLGKPTSILQDDSEEDFGATKPY